MNYTPLLFICQASFALRQKADEKGPDEEELTKLANSVDEFSYSLLNLLKKDKGYPYPFADSLDNIMDYAIEMKQKKVIKKPRLLNLTGSRMFQGR